MPTRKKIDLKKWEASLDTTCPKCQTAITPDKVRRVGFNEMECPSCHERFVPQLA